jgi:hypothetical protein
MTHGSVSSVGDGNLGHFARLIAEQEVPNSSMLRPGLNHLLQRMLAKRRISAKEILRHSWLDRSGTDRPGFVPFFVARV